MLASYATGANLRTFTEEATGNTAEAKKNKKPPAQSSTANSAFRAGVFPANEGGSSFLGSVYAWWVAASVESRVGPADGSDGAPVQRSLFPRHRLGEATAPYVRVDMNRQSIDAATHATDLRIELGYKMGAFHGRTTRYETPSLGQELNLNQFYGVVRYGGSRADFLPGTFEVAVGLGVSQIKFEDALGSIEDSTLAFTLPVKYYPIPWFGVEFRPAWYTWNDQRIGDYDLSASAGWNYVQVRAGYRWLGFGGSEDLNGPYAGLSVSF